MTHETILEDNKKDKKFFDGLFWGGFIIVAGLIFFADSMGVLLPSLGDDKSWRWIFLAAGVYGLVLTVIRVVTPTYVNPDTSDYFGVGLLFVIALSGLMKFDNYWPFVLIFIGVSKLVSALKERL